MRVRYHLVVAALIITLTVSSFVAGWQFQASASTHGGGDLARLVSALVASGDKGGAGGDIEDVSLRPLETFQEVLNHLRSQYLSPIKDENKLTYYAVQGMLAALREPPYEDRYSRFMEPDDYRAFRDENQGHFGGIGAEMAVREAESPKGWPEADVKSLVPQISAIVREEISDEGAQKRIVERVQAALADGAPALPEGLRCPKCGADISQPKEYQIVIIAPLPNSPAERAGLKPGDEVLKVDGASTATLGLGETVKRIKGRPGTEVTLSVQRKGEPKLWEVKIIRAVIQVHSVEWKMLADKIAYLHISTFNETTPEMLKKAMQELRQGGMRAMLLDLRGNAGGELDACVEAASQFLGSGPVVYIEERDRPRRTRNAVNGGARISVPFVVLIDNGSASAAEILAGAIQDNQLGTLVGAKTFGKGLVQTVYPLQDGSALALTTARYLTPSLRDIDKKGIEPDLPVKQPESKETILPLSDNDAQAKAGLKRLYDQLNGSLRAAA